MTLIAIFEILGGDWLFQAEKVGDDETHVAELQEGLQEELSQVGKCLDETSNISQPVKKTVLLSVEQLDVGVDLDVDTTEFVLAIRLFI